MSQSALHNCPMITKEYWPSLGMTWQHQAADSKYGIFNSAVYIEYINLPFAVVIVSGLFLTLQLMIGASMVTKCDVALLSTIDIKIAGGPTLELAVSLIT
jgi:hypothetical protein